MFAEKFEHESLRRDYAEARSCSLLGLKKLVAEQDDILEAEVSPGEEGLASLCLAEKARWLETVHAHVLRLLCIAGATVALACIVYKFGWALDGSGLEFAAAGTSAIAACWLLKNLPTTFGKLHAVLHQGFDGVAPFVFKNHGRSIWIVGSRGIYVALNRVAQSPSDQVEFLPFDGIGGISITRFEDETLVSL